MVFEDQTALVEGNLTKGPQKRVHNRLLMMILVLVIFLVNTATTMWTAREARVTQSPHRGKTHTSDRCFDANRRRRSTNKIKCNCQDPSVPVPRRRRSWQVQHERVRENIKNLQNPSVAIFGDSIVERLGGTKLLGTEKSLIKPIFHMLFPLGVALGSSGDSSPELLWHLQNGWLDSVFQPNVMVLLIGTNDLGRHGCNKENALSGILEVAEYLVDQRPNSTLLVHGILPRFNPNTNRLGRYHRDILWINKRLAKMGNDKWEYMDASTEFGNHSMFEDGLHPNVRGYRTLLSQVAHRVQRIRK